jgi:oligopeptide/dipeptide ABC transporter ATP-binding protein
MTIVPPVLDVTGLRVTYRQRRARPWQQAAPVHAVDGVSFRIGRGETLGLVGESGCGKSSVGRAVLRLTEPSAGRVVLEGEEITGLSAQALRRRRSGMQIIFQDPSSALDPRMTVEELLSEPLLIADWPRPRIRDRLREVLEIVSLQPEHLERYPHEFSGGQKQRIGIARALALEPRLLVCDEPVSALDVSVQAQIVNLMREIQERLGLSYLFIAHDLGVVRQISHHVAVMYLGRIVESGTRAQIYGAPSHPYTRALLAAAPRIRPPGEDAPRPLPLSGELPDPAHPPSGCRFRTRCPIAMTLCAEEAPETRDLGAGHLVACHLAGAPPPVLAPGAAVRAG